MRTTLGDRHASRTDVRLEPDVTWEATIVGGLVRCTGGDERTEIT